MWSLVLGVVSAIALGVLTEIATGGVSRGLQKLRVVVGDRRSLRFDVRADGLFALGEWSPARQLEPHRLITELVPATQRIEQPWIDATALAEAVRVAAQTKSGATQYLAGFRIDHRESDETQLCRVLQAASQYPEVIAIEHLRIHHPELFTRCDEVIAQDVSAYIREPVPSSLAVDLIVVSSDGSALLAAERSAAVDSAVGWWTLSVLETIKQPDSNRPGSTEDLYELAERGLVEELGLRKNDYGKLMITWLGIYRPILRGHMVAVVRLRITREELLARVREAHSGYEHAAVDWLPLRRSVVQEFVQAPRSLHPGKVGFTFDAQGRTWIDQSRLALLEAWRFKHVLDE